MVDKYVDDISLTDEEIRHIEHSIRGQQSSNLWWEYRKDQHLIFTSRLLTK